MSLLCLSSSGIVDVSPLAGLASLGSLILCDNQIVDVAPLAEIETLSYLVLYGNQIVDIGPLGGLTELVRLDVRHNRLDLSPGCPDMRDIEALQQRGVTIDYDPQS